MVLDYYATSPFGSVWQIDMGRWTEQWYLSWALRTPKNIQDMLVSPTTGAFIQGLAKEFSLPESLMPKLAFIILQVGIGKVELSELGGVISSELKLPNDKAQGMAREIERELFAPYMVEFNQFKEEQKKLAQQWRAQQKQAGVQNVVDLKNPPPQPAPRARKSRT